jgi:GNAT superfamily N-acetyltransferase
MLQYRTFRNTDPPLLAELWRSRADQPGLVQPVSVDLFEQLVFGKLHFDYPGMILAFDDGRLVGFVHAAFGFDDGAGRFRRDQGVTCMMVVRPDCNRPAVAQGLLEKAESYLIAKGAKVIYGGGIRPHSPFYLGLYGGSEPPGIIEGDALACELYPRYGYSQADRTLVFQLNIGAFRMPVDRQHIQYRRRMLVQVIVDPPARDWWEACTIADFDLTRYELVPRGGGPAVATALFRSMESIRAIPGPAVGLIHVQVAPECRRQGLAGYLLGETFRMLTGQGIVLVEGQACAEDAAGVGVLQKLGFQPAGSGVVFRKEVGGTP